MLAAAPCAVLPWSVSSEDEASTMLLISDALPEHIKKYLISEVFLRCADAENITKLGVFPPNNEVGKLTVITSKLLGVSV